jgi:hypothetical protein
MGVITEAAHRRWGSGGLDLVSEKSSVAALDAPISKALGNACATCRGACCPQGGEHAFLQPETILRVMGDRPEMRPREILDAYLARLGERTYIDSCVFHARTGCRLPRSMRADLCNDFLCKGLNAYRIGLENLPGVESFVFATRGAEVVRAAAIDGDGVAEPTMDGDERSNGPSPGSPMTRGEGT